MQIKNFTPTPWQMEAALTGKLSQLWLPTGLQSINDRPAEWNLHHVGDLHYKTKKSAQGRLGAYFEREQRQPSTLFICPCLCPLPPSTVLALRESWHLDAATLEEGRAKHEDALGSLPVLFYRRDYSRLAPQAGFYWRPATTLPPWAVRLFIRVESANVQRLQQVTEEDARAAGAREAMTYREGQALYNDESRWVRYTRRLDPTAHVVSQRGGFYAAWERRYAKKGLGWQHNPWVWKLSVRVLTKAEVERDAEAPHEAAREARGN